MTNSPPVQMLPGLPGSLCMCISAPYPIKLTRHHLPVKATRENAIARDTSNQICNCERPRGSDAGLPVGGRVEVVFSTLFMSI